MANNIYEIKYLYRSIHRGTTVDTYEVIDLVNANNEAAAIATAFQFIKKKQYEFYGCKVVETGVAPDPTFGNRVIKHTTVCISRR